MSTNDKKTAEIKAENWNRLVTYSFEVGKIKDGGIERLGSGNSMAIIFSGSTSFMLDAAQSGANIDIAQQKLKTTAVSLRIPPQSLSMQTQFASSVIATNKGILEENAGVVFRTISISGTTGVWADRPQEEQPPGAGMKALSAFFPGAVAGVKNTINAVKKTASAFVKALNQAKSLRDDAPGSTENSETDIGQLDQAQLKKTGYYQFWELYNFFAEYAEFKKTPEGKDYCLIFNNGKDNLSFAVTPLSFDLRRDSRNPLLYNYSITIKAWKVINAIDEKGRYNQGLDIRSPSLIKQILETIRRARKTIQAAEGTLTGIQSDIGDIVNIAAQSHMLAKDAVNLSASLFDMPNVIKNNAESIWIYNNQQMKEAISKNDASYKKTPVYKALNQAEKNPVEALGASEAGGATGGSVKNTKTTGETQDPTTPSGENANANVAVKTAMSLVASNPDISDSLSLSSLNLSPELIEAINKNIAESEQLTAGDLLELSDKLQELSNTYAEKIGLSGNPANAASQSKEPTDEDIILLTQIQELKESLISLTVILERFRTEQKPDTVTPSNEILPDQSKMELPTSFYPVTILRGDTLESIASRYLGSTLRWQSIADLNQLASPYIDEKGNYVNITNCKGKTFNVSKEDRSKLFIGQNIVISGNGLAPTRRKILNIQAIDGSMLVTVSGNPTLSAFDLSRSPKVFARTPKTLGPGDTILIPSTQPPDQPEFPRTTPLIASLSHAEQVFLVDMSLDENGDLKVDASGDVASAAGYKNAIQAIRNIMEIEQGEIKMHSDFGMPDLLGSMNSLVSKKQIEQVIKQRLLLDPRFKNANVFIKLEGSTVNIRIEASGASGTGLIPVEFQTTI